MKYEAFLRSYSKLDHTFVCLPSPNLPSFNMESSQNSPPLSVSERKSQLSWARIYFWIQSCALETDPYRGVLQVLKCVACLIQHTLWKPHYIYKWPFFKVLPALKFSSQDQVCGLEITHSQAQISDFLSLLASNTQSKKAPESCNEPTTAIPGWSKDTE